MKKYIVYLVLLFFSMFAFCACLKQEKHLSDLEVIKKRGYLIVGVKDDSPPFGFYKDDILQGIDIEIANEIATQIFGEYSPANIKFITINPQNRIEKLNSKEADILVATMSINEKRKLILNFSAPYFTTSQKIMVKKNSKITSLNYFSKTGKLAIVLGTTGEKILKLVSPNAQVIGATSYKEAYNMLLNNRVDAILGDDCILSGINDNKFKILSRAYSNEYYAVALRKSEDSKELLNKVNSAIVQVLDEKKINLYKKRFMK